MRRGLGRGGGQGRGWRNRYDATSAPIEEPSYATPSGEHEMQALRAQAEQLEGMLGGLKKRIAVMEASTEKEG